MNCCVRSPGRASSRPMTNLAVGGEKIKCLWDSGAQITLIDHRKMSKLARNGPEFIKRLPKPAVKLCGADGKEMTVLSMYSLQCHTGKRKIEIGRAHV